MLRFAGVLLLLLALGAAPAHAVTTPPATLTQTTTTTHFVVHFTTAVGDPSAISDGQATQLAANAESDYATESSWGWPKPLDDGDGHIDVYVFQGDGWWAGLTQPLTGLLATPSIIYVDSRYVASPRVIAHELFHVFQGSVDQWIGPWLREAASRWAEMQLYPIGTPYASFDSSYLARPDASLDCGYAPSCPVGSDVGGYGRWVFLKFLTSRYGNGIIRDVFDQGAAHDKPGDYAGRSADRIDAALQTKGSSLARDFQDFAVANVGAAYTGAASSPTATTPLAAGTSTTAKLDHLSAKYFRVTAPVSCDTKALHVRVTLPLGIGAPTLVVGSTTTSFNGVGGIAGVDVQWNTCQPATLVLVNTSSTLDAQAFTVETSLGGDLPPVTGGTTTTPGTKAAAGDVAPTLALLGAGATLKLKSSKPLLALTLSSDAPGSVQLSLDGATPFKTLDVNPGTNTLRVTLPRGLSGRKTLLLTSLSPGGVRGSTLRQPLAFVR